jgi:cytochrome b6
LSESLVESILLEILLEADSEVIMETIRTELGLENSRSVGSQASSQASLQGKLQASLQGLLQRLATLLAVVALTLVLLAGLTGVLLAFYYEPTASAANTSLRWIDEAVPGGNLVHSLHEMAGNGIILVALLQIFVMFFGRVLRPAWFVAWLSGGFLALVAIGLGWTAMILDWDQIGYWRLKVETGILGDLPVIGPLIHAVFLGGDGITSTTVAHMYAIHSYLLSAGAVVLSLVHLGALVYQERQTVVAAADLARQNESTISDSEPLPEQTLVASNR